VSSSDMVTVGDNFHVVDGFGDTDPVDSGVVLTEVSGDMVLVRLSSSVDEGLLSNVAVGLELETDTSFVKESDKLHVTLSLEENCDVLLNVRRTPRPSVMVKLNMFVDVADTL